MNKMFSSSATAFVLIVACVVCGACEACGDTVNVTVPANSTGPEDPDKRNITFNDSGNEADSGTETTQDGSTAGGDGDAGTNISCTTGYVRCTSGLAQECIANSWVTVSPNASCDINCTAGLGQFVVDYSQPVNPAVAPKGAGVAFLRRLTPLIDFGQAKTYCTTAYGSGWKLTYEEPIAMASGLSCNPLSDQAAFLSVQPDEEIWAWNRSPTDVHIFSFKDNTVKLINDTSVRRRAMCVRDFP